MDKKIGKFWNVHTVFKKYLRLAILCNKNEKCFIFYQEHIYENIKSSELQRVQKHSIYIQKLKKIQISEISKTFLIQNLFLMTSISENISEYFFRFINQFYQACIMREYRLYGCCQFSNKTSNFQQTITLN